MNIQWYPGHMAKSKRLLGDKLKLINIAVIVVDARAPYSTFNPDLKQMLQGRQCMVVVNKSDLAEEEKTKAWVDYYKQAFGSAMAFSATQDKRAR